MAKSDLQEQAKSMGLSITNEDGKDLTVAELQKLISQNTTKSGEGIKPSTSSDNEETDHSIKVEKAGSEKVKLSTYPKYKRPEKTVHAVRILCIKRKGNNFTLELEGDFKDVSVDVSYIAKYDPKPNGYFVTCHKGCKKYLSETEMEEFDLIEKES